MTKDTTRQDPDALPDDEAKLESTAKPQPNPYTSGDVRQEDGL